MTHDPHHFERKAMTVRLAALLIVYDGVLPRVKGRNAMMRAGVPFDISAQVLRGAVRRLQALSESAIESTREEVRCGDLGALADWLADEIDTLRRGNPVAVYVPKRWED